jgi:hypothetical protein
MPNIYHGSLIRFFADAAIAALKSPRRQFRTWMGLSAARGSDEAAQHLRQIWNYVRDGAEDRALEYTLGVAATARQNADAKMLWWINDAFSGLEQYEMQGRALYESRRMRQKVEKDWDGKPVAGALLADFRHRTPAWPVRHARFLPLAAKHARECITICEPRLAPLFQRSFPQVRVLSSNADVTTAVAGAEAVANHQDLFYFFGKSGDAIERAFVPLRPDPVSVATFRERYGSDRPRIGVSWGSSNQAKAAPAFKDWAPIFEGVPASFVSLQYGSIGPALKKLRRVGGNLIYDETVDQLVDLDQFAAQIAALDAVISTSSTVVHFAGALGVPCVVILDESSLIWPLFAARTPWYPHSVLVHRKWRAWPEVMKDAKLALTTMLSQQPNKAAAS